MLELSAIEAFSKGAATRADWSTLADMLNVSRPHLVKLLEKGGLPFHRTGKHRRVRFADLMQFKSQRDQASEDAMADLAKQAQELAMGYE